MSAMMVVFLVIILSVLVMAVGFAGLFLWVRRLRREAAGALRDELAEDVLHVADCNFMGMLSSGYAQVRGNGLLALTRDGLRFRMLLPRRSFYIPLSSIKGVTYPRRFLGKFKGGELLRVDFANSAGKEDACAWLVADPHWWGEAIAALLEGKDPPPPDRRS